MIDLHKVPYPLVVPIFEGNLRRLEKRHKVYDHFLEAVRLRLQADAVWFDRGLTGGKRRLNGDQDLFDPKLTRAFARAPRKTRRLLPKNLLLSRVEVHGRLHGVVGAARRQAGFEMGKGRELTRLATVLAGDLERRQEQRLTRVLARIRGKMVSELEPKDLAYQILDGLHQLVRYDHSAALLTWHEEEGTLRVAAEKIVWTKAKSAFIGHEVKAAPGHLAALKRSVAVRILSPEIDEADRPLRTLLDYYRGQDIPEVRHLLCAPLFHEDQFLGVLKIADYVGRPFDTYDVEVVERFLPAAAVSLRNVQVKQALENQAMQAEIRAGLVTLARAVAHDVNNAIGTVLPLAEQAREDLRQGQFDPAGLAEDLELIIEKATLCKRIFSNMLRVGGQRAGGGPVDLSQIGEEMMSILEAQLAARSVNLKLDLSPGLPPVRFSRPHLERVLWNLVTNSIEAMAGERGTVTIRAWPGEEGRVNLSVKDDGPGMDADLQAKVQEPFFTTKPNGTGLGLSLVRSLVWQNDGILELSSTPGEGTEVRLDLEAAPPPRRRRSRDRS